jgi:hypothetical protein
MAHARTVKPFRINNMPKDEERGLPGPKKSNRTPTQPNNTAPKNSSKSGNQSRAPRLNSISVVPALKTKSQRSPSIGVTPERRGSHFVLIKKFYWSLKPSLANLYRPLRIRIVL